MVGNFRHLDQLFVDEGNSRRARYQSDVGAGIPMSIANADISSSYATVKEMIGTVFLAVQAIYKGTFV